MTDAEADPQHALPAAHRRGLAFIALLLGLALYGCSSAPTHDSNLPAPPPLPEQDGAPLNPPDVSKVPDAVPRVEPRSRYGNPDSYTVLGEEYHVQQDGLDYVERGRASWYGTKFHGQRTSSGEPYDMYAMSAAHRTLPIPSYARVTNLANGKSVVVRVNDRGPFHSSRLIDLSYTAAAKLGMLGSGTANVEVRAIDPLAALQAGPARTAGTTTRTTPQTAAAAQTGAHLYLQVGAFTKRSNADRLAARLHQADIAALRISPATHRNTTVYRVQVGPLASAADAARMSERLNGLGIGLPHIVQD